MVHSEISFWKQPWLAANNLALDAMIVASAWLAAFTLALGLTVNAAECAVLGLSVWLVYTGDRWLDTRGRDWQTLPTTRHRLMARRRKTFLTAWTLVLIADVALAFSFLTRPQLATGALVFAICLAYTASTQRPVARRWTKELRVGLIFALGVGMFFAGKTMPSNEIAWLLAGLGVFALACFANCALIAKWEIDVDKQLARQSLARAMGNRAERLNALAYLTVALGFGLGYWLRPAIGLGVYGVLLAGINHYRWPVDLEARRALADGALALLGVVCAVW